MTLEHLPMLQQIMLVLASMVLLISFILMDQVRLVAAIHTFAWQGALIAAITTIVAVSEGHIHLYFSALLTFTLKALLIPWMLHRQVRKLELDHEKEALEHPVIASMIAVALVIFSYWLVLPIVQQKMIFTRNVVAISLAVVLIGFLIMVVRKQAIAQVLGFMSIENGLFLAAVSATRGMPLIIELGVAFDVLVAMVLFGIFFFQIRESIESLDVDRLNHLSESEKE